jgi:DNA-binding transcriptional MerR regulator
VEKPAAAIPPKRYFTIGEVSELCGVKPYVLRYWEQEFTQLRPMKRRGNRRYYQHHEVLLIRRIRDLLYEQGFTISGARNRLADATAPGGAGVSGAVQPQEEPQPLAVQAHAASAALAAQTVAHASARAPAVAAARIHSADSLAVPLPVHPSIAAMRQELLSISALLAG